MRYAHAPHACYHCTYSQTSTRCSLRVCTHAGVRPYDIEMVCSQLHADRIHAGDATSLLVTYGCVSSHLWCITTGSRTKSSHSRVTLPCTSRCSHGAGHRLRYMRGGCMHAPQSVIHPDMMYIHGLHQCSPTTALPSAPICDLHPCVTAAWWAHTFTVRVSAHVDHVWWALQVRDSVLVIHEDIPTHHRHVWCMCMQHMHHRVRCTICASIWPCGPDRVVGSAEIGMWREHAST